MASGSGLSSTGSPGCPRSASTPYPRRYRQTDRTHTPSSPPAPARSWPGTAAGVKSLRPTCRPGFRSFDRTRFERCARRFSFAASESRDGGVEEFVESVPSLRFSAAFYARNWALSSKSVVFRLQHRNSRRQRGKSHGHSPQLVIRQTLRPGLTLPKIIPRQRPSHAKHAGKPAGQANP